MILRFLFACLELASLAAFIWLVFVFCALRATDPQPVKPWPLEQHWQRVQR